MGETVQYKNLKGPELVSGPLNVDNHHLLVIVYYFILKESSPIGEPFNKKCKLKLCIEKQAMVKRSQYRSLLQIHHRQGHHLQLESNENPFVFMIQLKKEHFFFAVWTLQRVITHGEQKTIAPGIKIKDYPVF